MMREEVFNVGYGQVGSGSKGQQQFIGKLPCAWHKAIYMWLCGFIIGTCSEV